MIKASSLVCCCFVAKLCPTLVIPRTVASQAPLSTGFPRQEYWSELLLPSPGHLPDSGIEPTSLAMQADSFTTEPPGKPLVDTSIKHEIDFREIFGIVSSRKIQF